MFSIKTRARFLTHGIKTKSALLLLLPVSSFTGLVLSALLFVLCSVYGAGTVFEGWAFFEPIKGSPALTNAVKYFFFLSSFLFLMFFSALFFTLEASFFYRTDKNQSRPKSFISFSCGIKTLLCGAYLFALNTASLVMLLLPGAVSAGTVYCIAASGGIPPAAFFAGAVCSAIQFAGAFAAAYILRGRYYMTGYLLYLNPLMSVREAVSSSELLMKGRLISTAVFRLQTLPWRVLRLFIFTFPFSFAYASMLDAVLKEKIFAEDKTKVNSPAVTFYIGKKSRFYEKTDI